MAKAQTEKKVELGVIVIWVAVVVLQMMMVLITGQVQVIKAVAVADRLLTMEAVQQLVALV